MAMAHLSNGYPGGIWAHSRGDIAEGISQCSALEPSVLCYRQYKE